MTKQFQDLKVGDKLYMFYITEDSYTDYEYNPVICIVKEINLISHNKVHIIIDDFCSKEFSVPINNFVYDLDDFIVYSDKEKFNDVLQDQKDKIEKEIRYQKLKLYKLTDIISHL